MLNAKYSLLALGFCAIAFPVQADDRDITEAEVNQVFENLFLLQSSIINTDDVELKDKQRKEISEEIVSYYTEDAIIKSREVRMTESLEKLPIINTKLDKYAYKNLLDVENKFKNSNYSYEIKNIDFMGQQVDMDVNVINTIQYDATGFEDQIKLSADVISKHVCNIQMKIDYDGRARISYENCKARTYISNIDLEVPDYMEDAMGTAMIQLDQNVVYRR